MRFLKPGRDRLALRARPVAAGACATEGLSRHAPPNLTILDPIWTTAYMSRNHGYMIYDTLFAMDEKSVVKPQMVDKYTVSPTRRRGRSRCATV
jgi:peptide/nickel transport system substrate-binding protein